MSFGYCFGGDPARTAPETERNFFVLAVGVLNGIDIETVRSRAAQYIYIYIYIYIYEQDGVESIDVGECDGVVSIFIRSSMFYSLWFGQREFTLLAWFNESFHACYRSPLHAALLITWLPAIATMYGVSRVYEVSKNWYLHRAIQQFLYYLSE